MSANPFQSSSPHDSTKPSLALVPIVKSDSAEQTRIIRQIYVGTGGDVTLIDMEGTSTVHKNVVGGSYIGPFTVVKIMSTGTTASDMVGYV